MTLKQLFPVILLMNGIGGCANFKNVPVATPPVVVMDAGRGTPIFRETTNAALEQDLAERLAHAIPAKAEQSPMKFHFLQYESPRETVSEQMQRALDFQPSALISIVIETLEDTTASGIVVYYNTKTKYAKDSKRLAKHLSQHLKAFDANIPQPQKTAAPLLEQSPIPAITIAVGNLTNPDEMQQLLSPAYREELGASIRAAIMDYFLAN